MTPPDFLGRWWIRIALFLLPIVTAIAAMSLTPPTYFCDLGRYTMTPLLFSCLLLRWLLFSARTRKALLWIQTRT